LIVKWTWSQILGGKEGHGKKMRKKCEKKETDDGDTWLSDDPLEKEMTEQKKKKNVGTIKMSKFSYMTYMGHKVD
jgi:hypothetical protein